MVIQAGSLYSLHFLGQSHLYRGQASDLSTLYVGEGSEVVDTSKITGYCEASPLLYKAASNPIQRLNKRKNTSPDVQNKRLATAHDHSCVSRDIDTFSHNVGNGRPDDIYDLLVKIEGRIEKLEKTISEDANCKCRCLSEERSLIVNEVLNEVLDKMDDEIIEARSGYREAEEKFDNLTEEFQNIAEEMREKLENKRADDEIEI